VGWGGGGRPKNIFWVGVKYNVVAVILGGAEGEDKPKRDKGEGESGTPSVDMCMIFCVQISKAKLVETFVNLLPKGSHYAND
jgi:hypothetical protein